MRWFFQLLVVLWILPAAAQQDVDIEAVPVAGSVYLLEGRGGNIGLCAGDDGAFLIDDQFAGLTDKIRAAVREVHDGDIRFLVNTHWHGDHTGGNENMSAAGVLIFSHDNVRRRLSTRQFHTIWNREYEPRPDAALPVVTFTDEVTFHMNGEEIRVFHVAHAHTDGDAVIHFPTANVVHTGDVYFNGMYPFLDVDTGGSIDGCIAAVEAILALTDDRTRIIPGHGKLSTAAELRAYYDMLVGVRQAVAAAATGGRSLADVQAQKPTAPFDARWGGGFIKPDVFVQLVYQSLASE